MSGKQHFIYGISTATALSLSVFGNGLPYFNSPTILIVGAAIGSLMPDIDTPKSIVGQLTVPVSFILNRLIGHRTYTHDPAIWIPLAIVLTRMYPLMFGFFIGYLGHIFLDGLTEEGIPVFYFFNKKLFHLIPKGLRFKSNSMVVRIVTTAMSVLTILVIWTFTNASNNKIF